MPELPHCRDVHEGSVGSDVVAHKRALARTGHIVWGDGRFTPYCGPYMVASIIAFQHAEGLTQDGVLGKVTQAALAAAHRQGHPTEWAYDAYAAQLLVGYCNAHREDPAAHTRQQVVAAWAYWRAHAAQIAYAQVRPIQYGKPPWVPSRADCSWYFTIGWYAGGGPDPNKRHYDGQGYTGTLIGGGTVCSRSDLEPADGVFYGYTTSASPAFPVGSPTHVGGYAGDDSVYEHGSDMGPLYVPLHYRPVNRYVHYEL